MSTFPTLTQGPSADDFSQEAAVDPTIRTQFEDGYRLTRNRFTVVAKVWRLLFEHLTAGDKTALEDFEANSVGYGGSSFSWANTDDGVTYEVRFAEPIKWRLNLLDPRVPQKRYSAEVVLEEANPAS